MNRKVFLTLVVSLFVVISVKFIFWNSSEKNHTSGVCLPIIAITQIIEHPSLDQERYGIIQALAKAGYIDGQTVKIVYQNAQGNMATAAQIVNQLLSQQPKVMVAISTPSAQAALAPCLKQNIPLIFTAVTDPLEAKLVKNLTSRSESVAGVSDALGIPFQIHLIKSLVPFLKTLGVIYNPGEDNSSKMVQTLRSILAAENITLVEATASKTSDVTAATQSLIDKVQAIYIPNDNTAVSAPGSIVLVAERHRIPVIAADKGSVEMGAVATYGYDRHALGEKAGHLVVQALQGTPVSTLPVLTDHPLKLFINEKAAHRMGVTLPPDMLQKAEIIGK